MLQTRIIPVLLLKNKGLVKTKQFRNETYIGDPINAVKIFNEKEVDELVFLDITASKEKKAPNFELLEQIATECFMPFAYGGGIMDIKCSKQLLSMGIEKLIVNTLLFQSLKTVRDMIESFGSQSVIASIDIKSNIWGKPQVFSHTGSVVTIKDPVEWAKKLVDIGIGELMVNSVDNDGMLNGYDIEMIKKITDAVPIPVIACGGARYIEDLKQVILNGGASAAAAGSMFVFHGKNKAVLITYPTQQELTCLLG